MRLFISISLPEKIKTEIIRIQTLIGERGIFEGTSVQPEHLHITLFFFGSVDDAQIPLIKEQLTRIKAPACTIHLKALDVNSRSRPSVLWVSVDAPCLTELAEQLQATFPNYKEERAFHGHITLARMKKIDKKALYRALDEITVQPLAWTAQEYALQGSQTLPEGPLYTTLGIVTLEEIVEPPVEGA